MITRRLQKNIAWIDLESPTQDEIRTVAKEFGLNPLVVHELSAPTLKPRVDLYGTYVYLILHFPYLKRERGGTPTQEIDFIVGKKFFITVRYGSSEVFHLFSKMFEASSVLGKSTFGPHAGFIFFHLCRRLYETLLNELAITNESLKQIEENIFSGNEREMVQSLSHVARNLLDFKRSLALHHDVLESFEVAGKKMFGEAFGFHLRTLIGEYYRVKQAVDGNIAFLAELRETNNSLLTTKQGETMKVLTIMAFVTFPLSLIASIFGMNTQHTPIVGMFGDFWIVIFIMVLLTISFFWFFRHKKWL
ncbi:MAG: hypothetical protein COV91_05320 [Candidatus Taylorbacteria bacterium CG11_big_fil_rev_8_21_14_0_20_46_11]|uniref:Magnesium transporter n=1 Tax=Candidatus Taylorbacteria bacterium CG11_big_fil_rev_8_21_14_0_20_46_11 TaxID=1975025 RepID=A0A2H0KAH2_9BACT|nr:MAG: hypothetical protein COV91_05320 [Candidatus Taylorbacteria bacterium CG11_big_fil_rev_8_21_14_0_20_46_11]